MLMCTKLSDGGHYMITGRHEGVHWFVTPDHCPKCEFPNLSIIKHLATETGDSA